MIQKLLSGSWKAREAGTAEEFDAVVPGDVHDDLLKLKKIENPYFSDNSERCGWVTERDWIYTKAFTLTQSDIKNHSQIEFDGVDTYADVYLNGVLIGQTENMFLKYAFPVDGIAKPGENELRVVLKSIKKEMSKFPSEGYFACFNVQRIFLRKAQCHFSWDWAPDFPAAGIWQDVRFVSYDCCRISEYDINTKCDGSVGVLFRLNDEHLPAENPPRRRMVFKVPSENIVVEREVTETKNLFTFKIDQPQLWWPSDLGEPHLYDYIMEYYENEELADQKSGRFGIREIKYVESPRKGEDGFNSKFLLNGREVFLKGANWVPLDIMTGAIKEDKYRRVLGLARDAGYNCLRCWGGGIYEKEIFYNLCDEYGIMVWQDFAFACADVPDVYPGFTERVIPEIEYQVKRLRLHPSIILWCGGNEKTGSVAKCKSYGDVLVYYTIRGIVCHNDKTRPFFHSSPWSYSDEGNDVRSGDSHCNSYQPALYEKGLENYRDVLSGLKAPLVSEIAVQGAPTLPSLRRYIPEDKLWPQNDIWSLHFMRNPYDGSGKSFAGLQLQAADEMYGKCTDVEDYCKKSMAVHAEFVKADAEFHRSRRDNCSAAMFWMLSDIWPCGTWALVDYYLIPKAAYFESKRAFRKLMPLAARHEDGVFAFAVNDTPNDVSGTLQVQYMDFSGNILAEKHENIKIPACSPVRAFELDDRFLNDVNTIAVLTLQTDGGKILENFYHEKLWKDAQLPDPKLALNILKQDVSDGRCVTKISVTAESFARMVNVYADGFDTAEFSDNYFDMKAGSSREIVMITDEKPDEIKVRSFTDEWWR